MRATQYFHMIFCTLTVISLSFYGEFYNSIAKNFVTLCSFEKGKPHFLYFLTLEVSPNYMQIEAVNKSFDLPVHCYRFVNSFLIYEEVLLIAIIFL